MKLRVKFAAAAASPPLRLELPGTATVTNLHAAVVQGLPSSPPAAQLKLSLNKKVRPHHESITHELTHEKQAR